MGTLLALNIVNGTAVAIFSALSIAALLFLILRRAPQLGKTGSWTLDDRPRRRWAIVVIVAALIGAFAAVVTLYVCEVVLNVFGLPLDPDTHAWVIAAFAAIAIALVNLWRTRWWRVAGAAASIVLFILTATLGINAGYGLNPTVASFLNINIGKPLAVPRTTSGPRTTTSTTMPQAPLWTTWKPPADMPSSGQYGTVRIPATASGFVARPAYLYLPPAALVAHPPALPILVMMQGQPGGPESSALYLPFLNAMASSHGGLGPIVLTVDQIGAPSKNPLCIDSPAGHVASYVMTDVVDYIRTSLHVGQGRQDWAIGGYSNGGECALSFGAKNPNVFSSILDISGEIAPSLGSPATTLKVGFGGNLAAYTAAKPLTIMKQTHYSAATNTAMLAIFTSGSADPVFTPQGAEADAAATAAGMTTYRFVGEGVGHRADAINFGFPKGLPYLYQWWGLAKDAQ